MNICCSYSYTWFLLGGIATNVLTSGFFCFVLLFFCNFSVLVGFLPGEIWVAFQGESQLQQSHANLFMAHASVLVFL